MHPRHMILLSLLAGCGPRGECHIDEEEPEVGQNLLLVILDDVSTDQMALYDNAEGANYQTPSIDCLAEKGLTFNRAWSFPSCSPTRVAMTTGQYPRRHNIGMWLLGHKDAVEVDPSAPTVAHVLQEAAGGPYEVAHFGKWHMSTFESDKGLEHPRALGYHHAGSLANLIQSSSGEVDVDYDRWEKVVDGKTHMTRAYPTSDTVDDTLDWIAKTDGPWFATVSFNAPHSPLHWAPKRYTGDVEKRTDDAEEVGMYGTMLAAADAQIGRLVQEIDPDVLARTTIVVVADNGTPKASRIGPNKLNSKATVFEGGVNVPMVVVGPWVRTRGASTDALVSLTDLLPTFAELAGAPVPDGIDGVSFAGVLEDPDARGPRTWLFTEEFRRNGVEPEEQERWVAAVRGEQYKLMWRAENATRQELSEAMYDLVDDPLELGEGLLADGEDGLLPEQATALADLRAEMLRVLTSVPLGTDG